MSFGFVEPGERDFDGPFWIFYPMDGTHRVYARLDPLSCESLVAYTAPWVTDRELCNTEVSTLEVAMGLGHMPRRSKSGRFLKGRWSSRTSGSGRKAKFHHGRHSKAKYRVVCKGKTKSWHRLLRAAKTARPKGCRVAKV